mmetsp:Transcript_116235/g.340011  ORF Transcript_116235/g.340011 Transcript_116235/m.340011 type:complete len:272 (-) Transcript_116235:176-991(-)
MHFMLRQADDMTVRTTAARQNSFSPLMQSMPPVQTSRTAAPVCQAASFRPVRICTAQVEAGVQQLSMETKATPLMASAVLLKARAPLLAREMGRTRRASFRSGWSQQEATTAVTSTWAVVIVYGYGRPHRSVSFTSIFSRVKHVTYTRTTTKALHPCLIPIGLIAAKSNAARTAADSQEHCGMMVSRASGACFPSRSVLNLFVLLALGLGSGGRTTRPKSYCFSRGISAATSGAAGSAVISVASAEVSIQLNSRERRARDIASLFLRHLCS